MNLDELIPDDVVLKGKIPTVHLFTPPQEVYITGKELKQSLREEIRNALIEHCNDNHHVEYPT